MSDYGDNTLTIGQRVELHPGCDLWMRGARYGEIVGFRAQQQQRGATDNVIYRVLMDAKRGVRRIQRIPSDRLRAI